MELILLEKVLKLGDLGDKVNVKPGYGRNYLVPLGKAVPATAENIAEFETHVLASLDQHLGRRQANDSTTDDQCLQCNGT